MRASALAVLVAIAGCSARSEPAAPPAVPLQPSANTSVAPTARAHVNKPPTNAEQAAADAVVAEALKLVGRVRELPPKAPVPSALMDRATLLREVERLMRDETPDAALAANTEMLFALDAVDADFDLGQTLTQLYAAELAGFYDPKLRHMVLVDGLSPNLQRVTLYHELVHALQDQYFDLQKALDWRSEASDEQGAVHALAEGDATSASEDVAAMAGLPAQKMTPGAFKAASLLLQASPDLARVPGIIARSMVAPYADGLAFVTYLREHAGGWSAVDGAFRVPPISTEQLLHPEKYLAHEPVVALPAILAPAGFAGEGFRDVMGEQGLRLLFEEWAPDDAAALGASDWGGDRISVFSQGDQRVVEWHLVFDNERAARRALAMLTRGALRTELARGADPRGRPFLNAHKAEALAKSERGVCQNREQRGPFAAIRRGSHIGVTLGPYLRTGSSVHSAGDCSVALAWARAVAESR